MSQLLYNFPNQHVANCLLPTIELCTGIILDLRQNKAVQEKLSLYHFLNLQTLRIR